MKEDPGFITHALVANLNAYYALVRALHEEGVLPISAVVNRLGDRLDFGRQHFPEESAKQNEFALAIYDGLMAIEREYAQQQPSPPAP